MVDLRRGMGPGVARIEDQCREPLKVDKFEPGGGHMWTHMRGETDTHH